MKKQINPTRIGVFVVGAIALAVAAVIVFGGGRFFAQKEICLVLRGFRVRAESGGPRSMQGCQDRIRDRHKIAE